VQRESLPEPLFCATRFAGQFHPGVLPSLVVEFQRAVRPMVLSPITLRLVRSRRKPSIVNRQNRRAALSRNRTSVRPGRVADVGPKSGPARR
jgi:hypothetical protein